jgi:hypothetical protein
MKLQATINKIDDWVMKLRIKINQSKSAHITFALCNQTCLDSAWKMLIYPRKMKWNTWEYISIEDCHG